MKQARVAKGVEIRDAADATKVRGDFLRHMEAGDFDFDLPEIYKRGFLRLYATYLGLDEKAVMADYNAFASGRKADRESARAHRAKEQFLGEMTAENEAPPPPENRYDGESRSDDMPGGPAVKLESDVFKKTPYFKAGFVVAAVAILAAIIIFVISGLSSGDGESGETASASPAAHEFTVSITALRDTSFRLYPRSSEAAFVHKGELAKGKKVEVKTAEPLVLIPFTIESISDLAVEKDGKPVDFSKIQKTPMYLITAPRK